MSKYNPTEDKNILWKVISGFLFITSVIGFIYKHRVQIHRMLAKFTNFLETVAPEKTQLDDIVRDTKRRVTQRTEDIVKQVKKEVVSQAKVVQQKTNDAFQLNERQEAIYQLIKDSGNATMSDISRIIAGVTNRTLRRDTTKLEKLGLIEQLGKTKDSIYKIRK